MGKEGEGVKGLMGKMGWGVEGLNGEGKGGSGSWTSGNDGVGCWGIA